MNLFNRKKDNGVGGIFDGGMYLRSFSKDGNRKKLFLLFIGIFMIGSEEIIPLMRPAIAEQLPIVISKTQEDISTTMDVLEVVEKDGDFAVPVPTPLSLVSDSQQQQLPISQDMAVTASDIAVEPSMPNESSLIKAVSGKKVVIADSTEGSQEVKLAFISEKKVNAEPTSAELAIVQNAAVLDSLSPPSSVDMRAFGVVSDDAIYNELLATDILSQPADIRALPEKYLVVRKDHSASNASSRLTAARTALSYGRYSAALGLFEELYKKGSWNESVSMGRAVSLQKIGQIPLAVSAYKEIVEKNPKNVDALTNMLGLLNGQGPDEAIEKLLQLRDIFPFNSNVTAQLGVVYGVARDYENALKYLEMADALKPGNPNILYNRAIVYDRMGRTIQAANIYRQILLLAGDGILNQNFPIETVRNRLSVIR